MNSNNLIDRGIDQVLQALVLITKNKKLNWGISESGCFCDIAEDHSTVKVSIIPVGIFENSTCCFLRMSRRYHNCQYSDLRDNSGSCVYLLLPRMGNAANELISLVLGSTPLEKTANYWGSFSAEIDSFGSRILEILESSVWRKSGNHEDTLTRRFAKCGIWPPTDSVQGDFEKTVCSDNAGIRITQTIKMTAYLHQTKFNWPSQPIYHLTIIFSDLDSLSSLQENALGLAQKDLRDNDISLHARGIEVSILPDSDSRLIDSCKKLIMEYDVDRAELFKILDVLSPPFMQPAIIDAAIAEIKAKSDVSAKIAGLKPITNAIRQSEEDCLRWFRPCEADGTSE